MVRAAGATASRSGATLPRWAHNIVSKGQATEALVRRLKTLRDNLQAATEIDSDILDNVRAEILKDDLMTHSSREARVLLACSYAELLRLYAPEPPFDNDELRKMFSFFLAVLSSPKGGLGRSNGPHFGDCISLIQTLLESRCFAIPSELDEADAIATEYCKAFFGLVNTDTQKNVEVLCASALSMILHFNLAVPREVVSTIIDKLSAKAKRENPSAYNLALSVASECTAELQGPVSQHFADVLFKAVQHSDDVERDEALRGAHTLIVHITKHCPALLLNVMPQLEEELRAADEKVRLIAVRTLGHIFGERSFVSKKHTATWRAYLARSNDKDVRIRLAWLEALRDIITNHKEMAAEVATSWIEKLTDLDEKVRIAAINVFRNMDISTLRERSVTIALKALRDRLRDGKHSVRSEALDALGHVYNLAFPEIESGDMTAIEAFGWIVEATFDTLMVGDETHKGALLAVQRAIHNHILPLSDDAEPKPIDSAHCHLKVVLMLLNPEMCNALVRVCNFAASRAPTAEFIAACKDFNGGLVESSQADSIRSKMLSLLKMLANTFTDPLRAAHDLNAFAKENDSRLLRGLARITDEAASAAQIRKSLFDLKEQMKQSQCRFAATIEDLIISSGFVFVNTSSIPALFSYMAGAKVAETHTNLQLNAAKVISAIAESRSKMLQQHTQLLFEEASASSRYTLACSTAIQGLAKLEKNHLLGRAFMADGNRIASLSQLARHGSFDEAKHSAKLLCRIATATSEEGYADAYGALEDLSADLVSALSQDADTPCAPSLIVFSEIIKRIPDIMAPHAEKIASYCLRHVLMRPFSQDTILASDVHWLDDVEIGTQATDRLAALRFLTTRCISSQTSDNTSTILNPVLRLLLTCLTDGEPQEGLYTGEAIKARFRYEASMLLFKLARRSACDEVLATSDFQRMSTMLQDESFRVREGALHRLLKYAIRKSARLPPRYYTMAFLVALDPEAEMREKVKDVYTQLQNLMPSAIRLKYFDIGLSRLLHLLNHHPDFEDAWTDGEYPLDTLIEASKYLEFYFECCANPGNLACLYHIAHRTKGLRDIFENAQSGLMIDDGSATSGLHALADLAMCLLKRRADVQGCIVGNYAGTVNLPRDLFVPYSTREEQNKVYRKSYLSEEALIYFQQSMKKDTRHSSKRKMLAEIEPNGIGAERVHKSKKVQLKTGKSSRRGRRRYTEGDDDAEEEVSASEVSELEAEGDFGDGSSITKQRIENDVISDDESVESATADNHYVGSARVRERVRKEKLARNAARQARRAAKTTEAS